MVPGWRGSSRSIRLSAAAGVCPKRDRDAAWTATAAAWACCSRAAVLLLTDRLLMREMASGSPRRKIVWRNSHGTGASGGALRLWNTSLTCIDGWGQNHDLDPGNAASSPVHLVETVHVELPDKAVPVVVLEELGENGSMLRIQHQIVSSHHRHVDH
jgi:hypothetical protein